MWSNGTIGSTYTPIATEVGQQLTVTVTAINSGGEATATSLPLTILGAPENTATPSITFNYSGSSVTLVANPGTWTGFPIPTYTYQWSNGPANSGSSYSPTAGEIGNTIRLIVTATNSVGTQNITVTSDTITGPPTNTVPPTINGTKNVDSSLTADAGTWIGFPAPTYTYEWSDGTTGISCTPRVAGTLTITVTATNNINGANYNTTAQTSVTIAAIPPSNVSVSPSDLPTITGIPQAGNVLTSTSGNWIGHPAPTFTYQWSNGTTGQTYSPVAADVGQRITVTVTATNSGGSASVDSLPVTILGAPSNTTIPSIAFNYSGSSLTLQANPGTWTGFPTPTYTYQWSGTNNTSSSYNPVADDVGYTISLIVTATNSVGTQFITVTSATITGPPINTAPPSINGTPQVGSELTAGTGGWTGFPAPTYTYAWSNGTSGSTCKPTVAGTLTLTVTATNTINNTPYNVTSQTSVTIVPPPVVFMPPVNTVPPTIDGTLTIGQTLTVSRGSWTGTSPITYQYKWGDNPVGDNQTYKITVNDIGKSISVTVIATNSLNSAQVGTAQIVATISSVISVSSTTSFPAFPAACYYTGMTVANSTLYVVSQYNTSYNNAIMAYPLNNPSGTITTTELTTDNGETSYNPTSICVDSNGNTYIINTVTVTDGVIFKINRNANPPLTPYAGCLGNSGYHDGPLTTGSCTWNTCPDATTNSLLALGTYGSLVVDSTNSYIYIADSDNNCIRKINVNQNTISTLSPNMNSANTGQNNPMVGCKSNNAIGFPSTDDINNWFDANSITRPKCDGNPSTNPYVSFDSPSGIVIDPTNTYLYIGDYGNSTIRQVNISDGTVTTIAGIQGSPGTNDVNNSTTNTTIRINSPVALTIDKNKNIYFLDNTNGLVRVLIYNSTVSTPSSATGSGSWNTSYTLASGLSSPQGICLDSQTNPKYLYFSDTNGIYSLQLS